MGGRELIGYLRSEGERKIDLLWEEAKAEAGRLMEQADTRVMRMREGFAALLEQTSAGQRQEMVSEARNTARKILLTGERELSERLRALSEGSLPDLRNGEYPGMFTLLAGEIPEHQWGVVKVNPQDLGIATERFPAAEIVPDEGIAGGLEVISRDGMISVDNTLKKRLEKAWGDILPELMEDIRGLISAGTG